MKRIVLGQWPSRDRGCYLRRGPIEPFKQDCQGCRNFINKINKIQSNGQFVPNKELGERVTLGMKCFFFEPDGQPKKIAQFPSNLCHVVLEQVGIVTNKKAPVKKQTF